MTDKEKPKVKIDDLTDSSLTPEEQESVKGGGLSSGGDLTSVGVGGSIGAVHYSTKRLAQKEVDEDLD